MSGLIVGLVLRTPITDEFNTEAKFIATVYADHAWEDGSHAHPAVDTVAGITGLSSRTVQRYCRVLVNIGMFIPAGKGPKGTNQYSFPLEEKEDGSVRLKLLEGDSLSPCQPDRGDTESGDTESGDSIVSPKQTTRHLIHEEEEKKPQKFNFSAELHEELKELGVFVSLWKDIELKLTMDTWTESDMVALIDWMLDTRKNKSKAAQGFVTRLRENTRAPKEYYKFEKRRLTNKWFPGKSADMDEPETSEPVAQEPEYVFVQADETITPELEQAWVSVLGQLSMEMNRGAFEAWVKPSRPVHFEGQRLKVAAESAYVRDMLESRLRSTVERLLVGILNDQVNVEFVVAVETE